MCDPLTIAGLALTAGSTVANTMANNQAAKARTSALQAERIRQQGLDQEADALNLQSQDRYANVERDQAKKAQELGEYLSAQQTPEPTAAEALPTTNSNITVQEENKQRGQARERTDQNATALANLRSFGELLGGIGREQARDASLIGQIGGFKRGSVDANNYALDAAAQKGAGLRTLGDVMGGVGSIATGAGLTGGSFGAIGSKLGFGPAVSPGAVRAATTGTPVRLK